MSYLVLARKYRPKTFETVTGQDHVTRTLQNAILRDKVGHAFLFTGPRGVGKTSISRIFARALNCEKGPTPTPCGTCSACKEIVQGTSLAVREIDGASHNSVDNVRELIESFRTPPPPGNRYKVYIIDEVHMLSTAAFNALLKSLEEPPPFTVFILATTESHKIPDTVISRCHRHDFRALSVASIEERLTQIVGEEKIKIEAEALRMIARLADGSMRDAQSLLDRVQTYSDAKITARDVGMLLGTVERSVLVGFHRPIFARDPAAALGALTDILSRGLDISLFLKELVAFWRELLVAKFQGAAGLQSLGIEGDDSAEILKLVGESSITDLQDLADIVRSGSDAALRSVFPRHALEALVVRIATREPAVAIATVIERLKTELGKGGGSGPSSGGGGGGRSEPAKFTSRAATPTPPPARRAETSQGNAAITEQVVVENQLVAKKDLNWGEFVATCERSGQRVLTELLRRLSINSFAESTLTGSGPEFTVKSILGADLKPKLLALLKEYAQIEVWKITLTTDAKGAVEAPGSIRQIEKEQLARAEKGKQEDLKNHPTVRSLQKIFPGTEIETIKLSR